jgi:hypothetical protein
VETTPDERSLARRGGAYQLPPAAPVFVDAIPGDRSVSSLLAVPATITMTRGSATVRTMAPVADTPPRAASSQCSPPAHWLRYACGHKGPPASGLGIPIRPGVALRRQLTSSLCSCVGLGQHEFERSLCGRLRGRLGGFDPGSRKPSVRRNPGSPCPVAILKLPQVPASCDTNVHRRDVAALADEWTPRP